MFKKKPKDKDKEAKGAKSSNNSTTTTTVTRLQNGNNVTTHTTTSTRVFTREEKIQIERSSSGSISTSGFSRTFEGSGFTPRSIFDNNSFRNEILDSDASPFSYGSQRQNLVPYRSPHNAITSSSYPTRSNPTTVRPSRPSVTGSTFNAPLSPSIPASTVAAPTPSATRSNSVVPTYEHNSRKLGKALIINNINFSESKEERKGAEKDSEDLKKLLKKLGFEVKHDMNVKGKDMLKKAKEFSRSSFQDYNISLVVMMSHGNNLKQDGGKINAVRGGFTQIFGVDSDGVLVDDIIDLFVKDQYHPTLKGRPKIFIFQCCRGSDDQEIAHDAAMIRNKPPVKEHSDILVAFSTLPGYLSNRDPSRGSWYIQSLCQVIDRHHKDHHLEDLLKIVDKELSNKHPKYTQTSTYENRGFKICFLTKP